MTLFAGMPQHTAKETCSCGATITVTSSISMVLATRLDEFHRAHAVCRARLVEEQAA